MSRLIKITEYLIYLFIFLLPWQTRWIFHFGQTEYQTWSIYGTEILLWAIILLAVATSINKLKTINANSTLIILAFLIWTGLSIAWANDKNLALYYFDKILEGISLMLILQIIPFDKIKFIWVFIAGSCLQAILGIYQFIDQSIFSSKWLGMASHLPADLGASVIETHGERILRAYGSLPHPNILAGFLVVGILLSTYLYFYYLATKAGLLGFGARLRPWLLLSSSVLQLICLFFTFSRGAWIALVVGLIIFLIMQKSKYSSSESNSGENSASHSDANKKNTVAYYVAMLLVVMLLVVSYRQLVFTRIENTERLEVKSTQERVVLYQQSFDIIKNHWLSGTGIGNYTLALQTKYPGLSKYDIQPVHNLYLMVLAELGVIGLIIFVAIIVSAYSFKSSKKSVIPERSCHPELDPVPYGTDLDSGSLTAATPTRDSGSGSGMTAPCQDDTKIILIAILIIGLFDHYLWTLWPGIMLLWLVIGLSSAKKISKPEY